MEEEKIIQEREKKLIGVLRKEWIWIILFLAIALYLGYYIRTQPMQDHGGHPGLWDITTNTWALGPDLDPWLFLRGAKEIVQKGSIPAIDYMRNVPLGFDTSLETKLLPGMIAWTYYIFHSFSNNVNIEFAGVIFPVIFFELTVLAFFFFVREIFLRKDEKSRIKASIIAFISTLFMVVIPEFLPRTIAGIPEKESAAFFFMFLSFYLYLKAWKSGNLKKSIIFSVLAGIATGLMGMIWGGVTYIFITMGLSNLVAFVLNKIHKKEAIIYTLWTVISISITIILYRATIKGVVTSIDTGLVIITVFIMVMHYLLWKTKLLELLKINSLSEKYKIPKNILSIIIAFILLIIFVFVFLGPGFITDKIKSVYQSLIKPVTGRWSVTVAENKQPYFQEWGSSFGPFIKNIPVLFWLFFIGSVLLFKEMLKNLKKKEGLILTGLYALFFFGLVFSRYAPHPSILDGEGLLSLIFYFGSAVLLVGSFVYYYIQYHKKGEKGFEMIDFEFLLLFSLFALTLFTSRSAVRLIMVLAPIAPIFASYLCVEMVERFRRTKDDAMKMIFAALAILVIALCVFAIFNFYGSVKSQAYNFVPSAYNYQWQKAMNWVRNETPTNAVFAHWWDYGYWVQSIGNRATVTDGGNAITYWNYLTGRLVLTGDNESSSLEFLYNHNATNLLIDSSDIGKYGAFSSIGSDKNYDRYSWIGVFLRDEKQTQETKNQTILVYQGGVALDEDLLINESGKEVLLPGQKTGIGLIVLPLEKSGNESTFGQPYTIVQYNGITHQINLRYLSVKGKFVDFKSGIEACAYVFPEIIPDNQGRVSEDEIGAAMFLSPRLMRGYLTQKYILDDPFKKFTHFKVVHKEQSLVVDNLNSQGMKLPDFVYFQGIQGPITIWEIEYTGKEKVKQEYLDKDYTKYIDWQL